MLAELHPESLGGKGMKFRGEDIHIHWQRLALIIKRPCRKALQCSSRVNLLQYLVVAGITLVTFIPLKLETNSSCCLGAPQIEKYSLPTSQRRHFRILELGSFLSRSYLKDFKV